MARTHHVLLRISTHLRRISTVPRNPLPKRPPVRAFSTSTPRCAAHAGEHGWPGYAVTSEQETAMNALWGDLHNNGSPHRVWRRYSALLQVMGARQLPLRLHHWVLRKCTPDTDTHRHHLRQRLKEGTFDAPMHEHEDRMRAVIHNMRADGYEPARTDYNFILHQFANVGYIDGVVAVYKELLAAAARMATLRPDHRTFGNLFFALAYRHTLPMHPEQRADLVARMQGLFNTFLADMQANEVDMTEANMDLVMRVLKATVDTEAIEGLLRWSYGIDLRNPDKLALEYASPASSSSSTPAPQRVPFAFTTTSLNTTLDLIGRTGDVSRLVQAFEVLTTPLPAPPPVDALEADEDEDWGVPVPVPAPDSTDTPPAIPLPCAQPNTTSYATLLRYISRENHATLARHYAVQALDLHRTTANHLNVAVNTAVISGNLSMEGIAAPHFAVNRAMLLPLLGLANRDKNLGLLRWLQRKMPGIVRKQREDLAFYRRMSKEVREKAARWEEHARVRREKVAARDGAEPPLDPSAESTPTSVPAPAQTKGRRPKRVRLQNVDVRADDKLPLATDVSPAPPASSSASSSSSLLPSTQTPLYAAPPSHYTPFSMAAHMNILARNVGELSNLATRIDFILARSAQRQKERMGRRVWAGKDVFFATPPAGSIRKDGTAAPGFFSGDNPKARASKHRDAPASISTATTNTSNTRRDEKRQVETYAARLRQAPFRPQRVRVTKDAWQGLVRFRELAPEYEQPPPMRARGPRFGPRERKVLEARRARNAAADARDAEVAARVAAAGTGMGKGTAGNSSKRASGAPGVRLFSTSAVELVRQRRVEVPPRSMAVPMLRWASFSSTSTSLLFSTTSPQTPPLPQQPTFLTTFSLNRLLSPLLSAFSSSRS